MLQALCFLFLFGGCVSSIDVENSGTQYQETDAEALIFMGGDDDADEERDPPVPNDPTEPDEPSDPPPEDNSDPQEDPEDPYVPEPGTESCVQWQDCGPHYGDSNSLYQCINNTCMCDPNGASQSNCTQAGGYFVAEECYCAMADSPPPSDPISNQSEYEGQECWYHWEDVPCEPDEWIDTSYYTEECYYDSNNELICELVYVNDGYWEEGYCPPGWWEVWCY